MQRKIIVKTKETCKKCGEKRFIENKHFFLCGNCNKDRLQLNKGSNSNLRYIDTKNKKQPLKKAILKKIEPSKKSLFSPMSIKSKTTKEKIQDDEKFYLECFNLSDHRCEECNVLLPDEFSDHNGKVIARWRYSHIVPKSIAPELRHNTKNINHLCLECHGNWENGDKKSMNIFKTNLFRFPNYLIKFV